LTSLHCLKIIGCHKFISFPEGGILHAPNLRELELCEATALESLPMHMHSLLPSLTELRIKSCANLKSFPEGGFPSNIKVLSIRGCDKLVADRNRWGLRTLASLSSLEIGGCEEELESFPEETFLPSSITSLSLSYFTQLKSLDYKGLEHLSSLTELKLSTCTKLQFLPEKGLPSSLQCLELWHCHETLNKRCQEQGEDWPKICHIPNIEIDEVAIRGLHPIAKFLSSFGF
ncbi:hypothetical protein Tsubulata_048614, partial [Turnera subulata]